MILHDARECLKNGKKAIMNMHSLMSSVEEMSNQSEQPTQLIEFFKAGGVVIINGTITLTTCQQLMKGIRGGWMPCSLT